MKKRVAYLVVDGKRFGSENSGLNVSFDVPYTGTCIVPNNSSFTLTNLNQDDLFEIVTNTARFTERRRHIDLYAGYSDHVEQIFGGEILQSSPTDIPDTTVNITALSNIQAMGKNVEIKYENPTFLSLIERACKECGWGQNISDAVKRSSVLQATAGQNWSYTGSARGFLRDVEIALGTQTKHSKDALAFVVSNDVLYVGFQNEKHPGTAPIISASTGLVGIPTPTEAGINLQVLMDVTLRPLQTIYLQSEKMKLYNGPYNIINVRHHGSLRGRDWYSDLECVKVV